MTQPFHFETGALSDIGCARATNEDHVRLVHVHDEALLASRGVLIMVADGMGGHLAGEVASQVAVESVHAAYYAAVDASPRDALVHAFEVANQAIFTLAEGDPRLTGMGTTGTALVLCGDRAFCANVGDSRIYLARDEAIYRMTSDDSAVGELMNKGLLSQADARHHADKNVILRAIGTAPAVTVSTWERPFPLRAGDRFLLCSDGLHDLVEDDELRLALAGGSPTDTCEQLVALARARGGHDNITVAVVHVVAAPPRPGATPITRETGGDQVYIRLDKQRVDEVLPAVERQTGLTQSRSAR